ncbi:MAG: 50S ribosomal protein L15 [Saprospiraceae bacterium]
MDLSNLKPAKGSVRARKRIGRGIGSGYGRTSGRGHKGAKSRSGYKSKRGFEGGQMPLQMRLPKRGFKSPNRVEYVGLNVGQLQQFAEKYSLTEITIENLRDNGIIRKTDLVKVLGTGELTTSLLVKVNKTSAKAKELIEAAGGSLELI